MIGGPPASDKCSHYLSYFLIFVNRSKFQSTKLKQPIQPHVHELEPDLIGMEARQPP